MQQILALYQDLLAFMQQGGWVLWTVFGTCVLLWLLIFERWIFYRIQFQHAAHEAKQKWQKCHPPSAWCAKVIRNKLISELSVRLHARLKLMQTLIIICPLMGLLGTVTGMVNLFELIAINGNSDVKAMSAGIYQAILPTLAGLVVGLSGFYFATRFNQLAVRYTQQLADSLTFTHGMKNSAS